MEAEDFRGIFECFQNLNLVVLIEDLRRKQVAVGGWFRFNQAHWRYDACPLAHGFVGRVDCTMKAGSDFTDWWDKDDDNKPIKSLAVSLRVTPLLAMLESILAERLDDADAFQKILEPSEFGAPAKR